MKQYLLSVYTVEGEEIPADFDPQPIYEAVDAFNTTLRDAGAWVFAGGLTDVGSATTVDGTGEGTVVTDGPFAESKEHLGGFWVIRAGDLDAALDWAARGSAACGGRVEVRAFQDEPEE